MKKNLKFTWLYSLVFLLMITSVAYSADEWNKLTPLETSAKADYPAAVTQNNTAIDRVLSGYSNITLYYTSAITVTATSGQIVCSNAAGTVRKMRNNPATTAISFSDIDTGSEAASTIYYVYASADADASTVTFKISLSSTSPTGVTYYKKIGSFYNDASSNIDKLEIKTIPYGYVASDSEGSPPITAIYNYSTSSTSYTSKTGEYKVAYGAVSIAGHGTQAITNLPFTGASTYSCSATFSGTAAWNDGYAGAVMDSGSQATITNQQGSTRTINWRCGGY